MKLPIKVFQRATSHSKENVVVKYDIYELTRSELFGGNPDSGSSAQFYEDSTHPGEPPLGPTFW